MNENPQNETTAPKKSGTAASSSGVCSHTHPTAPRPPHQAESTFSRDFLARLRDRLPEYLTAIGHDLRRQGTRLVCHCPLPGHHDTKPSFAVLPNRRTSGCFPCGWNGDVIDLAMAMGRAHDFRAAVQDVSGVLGLTPSTEPAARPVAILTRPKPPPPPPPALTPNEQARIRLARLAFCDAVHDDDGKLDHLVEELGIPLDVMKYASRGTDGLGLEGRRLCYAYSTGLKLRGLPGEKPRFRWLCGRASAPWRMGWGMLPAVRKIYLSEGESDCLAMLTARLEDDPAVACVANPGTSFPAAWARFFRGREVVICFDSDKAGQDATMNVARALHGHATKISTWRIGQ